MFSTEGEICSRYYNTANTDRGDPPFHSHQDDDVFSSDCDWDVTWLRSCSHYTRQLSFRVYKVWTAMAPNWNKSFTHIKHCTGAVDRKGLGSLSPNPHSWTFTFTPENLLPSQWIPVFSPAYSLPLWSKYLFTLHQSVTQNLIQHVMRSVTEIPPKSPFLCVNRGPMRYGFRAGAKPIGNSVNTA